MEHKQTDAHPLVPYRLYVIVWIALVILTGITVAVSYIPASHVPIITAIIIALIKSVLVLLYFMHLRFERRAYLFMILAVLVTYVIFVVLLFSDYKFRDYL